MRSILLFIAVFCLSFTSNAQNTPPTIKARSAITFYGQQVCIDIETEDADGDTTILGITTQIPQSQFIHTNSYKKLATGSICFYAMRGVHSDQVPNTSVIFATDRKDTTYKTISVTIPRYPHTVRPVIEKINYNTFKIDVKGDKSEPWGDYKGLTFQSKIFDMDNKLLLTDTNQVFTFTAPTYEKYIFYVSYLTSFPALYVTKDTLYPDMNVSTHSLQKNSFSIYPNPTTGKVFIENLPEQTETITVFDVLGKVMKRLKTTSNTLSIENLPNGIYWVEVKTLEHILGRQKIIKVN